MTDHPERRVLTARVWPAMYDELEQARIANHRSLGAEIVYRLEQSLKRDREEEAMMEAAMGRK